MRQLTRREFGLSTMKLTLLASSTSGFMYASKSVIASEESKNTENTKDPTQTADKWLQEWQRESIFNKDLEGPLNLRRFRDPVYVLLESVKWKPGKMTPQLTAFAVPRGFVTDFASVPRVFWSLFRPDGNYAYAAVLHDYLYWHQQEPKSFADSVFRAAMDDLKITDAQASILFNAVSLFGSSAWENNAKLKRAGEKRILSELPNDPTMTWEEWKTRPGVFYK